MKNIPIEQRVKAYKHALICFDPEGPRRSRFICDHLRHYFNHLSDKEYRHDLSYWDCPELFPEIYERRTKEQITFLTDGWFHDIQERRNALEEAIKEIEETLNKSV